MWLPDIWFKGSGCESDVKVKKSFDFDLKKLASALLKVKLNREIKKRLRKA